MHISYIRGLLCFEGLFASLDNTEYHTNVCNTSILYSIWAIMYACHNFHNFHKTVYCYVC